MTRRPARPRLLTVGAAISTFTSAIWCIILFGYALGHGEISAAGEPIPRDQLFARGGGWLVAAVVIWVAVSVGIWLHRTWARPLALVFWPVLGGAMASASPDTSSAYGYLGFACACALLAAICTRLLAYAPTTTLWIPQRGSKRRQSRDLESSGDQQSRRRLGLPCRGARQRGHGGGYAGGTPAIAR